jgi:hypothetical protein
MRLRLLTLSTFALAVIGCLSPQNAPEGSTSAADTNGAISCLDTCEADVITDPTYNPWAGQTPGHIVAVQSGNRFVVFGYDATFTNPASWPPFITDCAALVDYLADSLACPAALPAACRSSQINVEIGQVGGGGLVPIEGGGNEPCKIVCSNPATLTPLATACPAPKAPIIVTTPPMTCHGDCV